MKTVTIRCEHTDRKILLRVLEKNVCCIQCGLIQLTLSPSQCAKVRSHCQCMQANLYSGPPLQSGWAVMTIDPSQLDLGSSWLESCRIG